MGGLKEEELAEAHRQVLVLRQQVQVGGWVGGWMRGECIHLTPS